MSIATTANNTFGFDIGLVIKSKNGNVIIVANDIDFIGIVLSLLNWFLGAVVAVLNFTLGWLDIPLAKVVVVTIWFKHLSKGVGGELWTKLSLRKTSVWA